MDNITRLVKMLKHGEDSDTDFDKAELKKGVEVEKEHTDSEEIAKSIAKAHLKSCSKYYDYLYDMEKEHGCED